MPITSKQAEKRRKNLGSSDIPAIMGFSRFATAYDVWMYKTGRIPEDPKERDYQTAGKMFEDGVLRWFSEEQKCGAIKRNIERRIEGTPILVHIDAELVDTGEPVEVKTEGLYGPIIEPWGDVCTDDVPEYTCIQAHCHMMATERDICHVPTFLGGRGFGYFYVNRDDKIVDLIREQALAFWQKNVLKGIPPADSAPILSLIKRIRRVEGEPVELDSGLVFNWTEAKEAVKSAKKIAEEAHARILAALDGAELGTCELCDITNFLQSRKGYTVEPTSYRVLRLKKRK